MPLILVSADYLRACGCCVAFLSAQLPAEDKVERKEVQYAECNFPDGGECGADYFPFPGPFGYIDGT